MPWVVAAPETTAITIQREIDREIDSLAQSIENLLVGYLRLLMYCSDFPQEKSNLKELQQRFILALVAVRFIPAEKLDDVLALNRELPTLPDDGIAELFDTVDDIRDFYLHVKDPTSAKPTVEVFSVEIKPQ